MRIIARSTLRNFWLKPEHSDSEQALRAWFEEAEKADWKRPNDVKKHYSSASIIGNDRVVFNICGNKYRLVVAIKYDFKIVYIRFIGTHKKYDKINVEEI
ncbi:MAG: type II toxin-antitoxin system HigB family toxin [Candidatus Omnitrophica bacterium]|nr:type II toxin-antitoxin system HigB family toxin [Candidatus Omnitrophota bacterium]